MGEKSFTVVDEFCGFLTLFCHFLFCLFVCLFDSQIIIIYFLSDVQAFLICLSFCFCDAQRLFDHLFFHNAYVFHDY